jgi:hypothetical protein
VQEYSLSVLSTTGLTKDKKDNIKMKEELAALTRTNIRNSLLAN